MTNPTDPTEPTEPVDGDETEDDGGMIDPSTGQPFPDTAEGRADKKAFITQRNADRKAGRTTGRANAPGQQKKTGDTGTGA